MIADLIPMNCNIHDDHLYSLVEWDTALIGKNVFQIHYSKDVDHNTWKAIDEKIRNFNAFFSFVKISADSIRDIRLFESLGYRFAENQLKVELNKNANPIKNPFSRHLKLEKINPTEEELVAEIIEIIDQIDFPDRYSNDELFGEEIPKIRYKNWIKNSVNDTSYDLFRYKNIADNQTVGFYLAKREENEIYLALLGICKSFQKRGLGIGLLQEILKYYQDENYSNYYSYISSVNNSALNLHSIFGFRITDSTIVLHKRYL